MRYENMLQKILSMVLALAMLLPLAASGFFGAAGIGTAKQIVKLRRQGAKNCATNLFSMPVKDIWLLQWDQSELICPDESGQPWQMVICGCRFPTMVEKETPMPGPVR